MAPIVDVRSAKYFSNAPDALIQDISICDNSFSFAQLLYYRGGSCKKRFQNMFEIYIVFSVLQMVFVMILVYNIRM